MISRVIAFSIYFSSQILFQFYPNILISTSKMAKTFISLPNISFHRSYSLFSFFFSFFHISPVKNFNFVTVSYNRLNLQNGFKNSEIQWYRI
ncbi:hypothetical protein TTE2767 [Caldanaerobacter subterraneus subsp. tengcongensis MB4]|uniref:Uncharacterized protein n=1 Tax=Caldanaerobacter subterraneus subsp. tengcongensis (strain DSM 15242 / JCM 11007 / NBRC 100824 / MB4) TaxID=273068 RepID=Q8R6N3_CALS4|nr:hypothetical protein TTE2767 [Caldanaerobacter subterraneus subsp. tengcongensis MB4]